VRIGGAVVIALAVLAALVAWLNVRGEDPVSLTVEPFRADTQHVERGAYLARAGNCMGCHTASGGAAYAGGRGIETPFGVVFASNITPDPATGIGPWTAAEFWRAMHNGRSRDGRLLYPAFPYPNFTQVTREDSDALYAYLRTVPAVVQANRAHALRFPYSTQAALAVWRALYFRPETFEPQPDKSAQWNRGGYLVRGLGHCAACHSSRGLLGATNAVDELAGGLIPMQHWYAPPLGLESEDDLVEILKTGVSARGAAMGPMAEVIFRSTQHLTQDDLRAMAVFLKDLPERELQPAPRAKVDHAVMLLGAKLYEDRCAACHGPQGQGTGRAIPPLAGNPSVTTASATNVLRSILLGGFAPTTVGNPRPYGMPPFGLDMNDNEVAAVASYIRGAWGNQAPAVSPFDVFKMR
jgi:mono/diheme cytochrome c family protein